MKAEILVKQEVDIKTCEIKAKVRYWEDATINGVEDTEGDLTPCREGDLWAPIIDVETGRILNWKQGVKASVHFKVCDCGSYYLKDAVGNVVLSIEGDYVPHGLVPGDYGDYIIMDISEDGIITNWPKNPSFEDFEED